VSDRVVVTYEHSQEIEDVAEVVEVIGPTDVQAALLREIARQRCEADEALELLESIRGDVLDRMGHTIGEQWGWLSGHLGYLDHLAQHLRWVSDPASD
jgi:cell division FtsZ-interacting protein ZapD